MIVKILIFILLKIQKFYIINAILKKYIHIQKNPEYENIKDNSFRHAILACSTVETLSEITKY